MIITIDTNVLFSALHSDLGASYFVLRLVIDEKVKLALSPQLYFEYYDVLSREQNLKKLNLSIEDIEDILDLLALLAKKHSIYFLLRPNLIDENDNMVCECAFAGHCDYLITSNIKDFRGAQLKGFHFKVITPGNFCRLWRDSHE